MLVARHTNASSDSNISYTLDDKDGHFEVDATTGIVTVVSPLNRSMSGFYVYEVTASSIAMSQSRDVVYSRLGVYVLDDIDLIFITIRIPKEEQRWINETAFQENMSMIVCPNSLCTVIVWNQTAVVRRRDSR